MDHEDHQVEVHALRAREAWEDPAFAEEAQAVGAHLPFGEVHPSEAGLGGLAVPYLVPYLAHQEGP